MAVEDAPVAGQNWRDAFTAIPAVRHAFAASPLRETSVGGGPALTSLNRDVQVEVSLHDGAFTITLIERGTRARVFETNSLSACAVYAIAHAVTSGAYKDARRCDFHLPVEFAIAERAEGPHTIARFEWRDSLWAEAPTAASLLDGLKWSHFATATWADLELAATNPNLSTLLTDRANAPRCTSIMRALADMGDTTVASLQAVVLELRRGAS